MTALRKLERAWKKKSPPVGGSIRNWDESLPTCKVDSQARGLVSCLPMVGFLTETTHQGLVLRVVSVLFRPEDGQPLGSGLTDYPVSDASRNAVADLVASMGWDGRIWPRDPGWPDDDADMETAVVKLASDYGVAQCIVFPSGDLSSCAQAIQVKNPHGWFPLDALPTRAEPVDPYLTEKFSALTVESFRQRSEDLDTPEAAPEADPEAQQQAEA